MSAPGTPLTVATDGSALGNPGPGGWAWVRADRTVESSGEAAARTTNNAMELAAIAAALRAHPGVALVIESDSQYAINCVTRWAHGWARRGWVTKDNKPVANRELIEEILALSAGRSVEYRWVRGHDGHVANERADMLARNAATAAAVRIARRRA
jgi:ribonuclease HI